MTCFTTGGPGKKHRTNKPPPTRRVLERSKGDTTCPTTSQNPSHWPPSWLSEACTTRKDSDQNDWRKTTWKLIPAPYNPGLQSHVKEQFSWVPLPCCSPPGGPFPIKSLALSAHMSPRTIHFRVLGKSSVSGPGRGPSFSNKW